MNTDKIYAEHIANEYAPQKTSKVVALKKLDKKAKQPATIFGYVFGILAALIMGTGMSFSMKVVGDGSTLMMAVGVIIGLLGILGCCINYPIYKKLLAKGKEKYASDILMLAKEISEE